MEEHVQQDMAADVMPIQEEAVSQNTSDELANKKYLKKRDYIFFSLAQFASSAVTGLVQGYLLFFYTVCVGIAPAAVGTMFLVSKIFDGLNDPIMGVIVDRTRTKWGKMRPYLFGAAIPWGVLTIVMFMPSIYASMGASGKIAFMWVTYLLYSVLGTAVGVPLNGLPAVASPNTDERAKIISISRILGSIGEQSALVLLTLFLILTNDNYPNSYMLMALIIGILGPLFMVLGAKFVKERLEPTSRTPNVLEGFKYLFKNKQPVDIFPQFRIGDDNLRRVLYIFQRLAADYILVAGSRCVYDRYDACAKIKEVDGQQKAVYIGNYMALGCACFDILYIYYRRQGLVVSGDFDVYRNDTCRYSQCNTAPYGNRYA